VDNCCTSVDAEKCAKLRASKNFENSLTTVKVMTKTKVAPFYLGHGVYLFSDVSLRYFL